MNEAPPSGLKIVTWNVNGIRAIVGRQRSLPQWLESTGADILCVQETKLRRTELTRDVAVADGWESFWSCCQPGVGAKTGYSGVATFCRCHALPVAVETGLTGCCPTDAAGGASSSSTSSLPSHLSLQLSDELGLSLDELHALDSEGRALITDHGLFLLVNLYGPALTIEERLEERLALKLNFYRVLEWRIRHRVAQGRAVVVVGDLNISPHPIDSCKPSPEFAQRPDRKWLVGLLGDAQLGLTDAFRHFHPTRRDAYSQWNTASGARTNNYGTRIDHILVAGPAPQQLAAALQLAPPHAATAAGAVPAQQQQQQQPTPLLAAVTACDIDAEQQGSDHAPVWATLAIPRELLPSGHAPPPGAGSRLFPGRQANLKAWLQQQQPQPSSSASQQSEQPSQPQRTSQQQSQQSQGAVPGSNSLAATAAAAGPSSSSSAAAASQGSLQAGSKRPTPAAQAAGAGSKRQRAGSQGPAAANNNKGGAASGQLSVLSFFAPPAAQAAAAGQQQQPQDTGQLAQAAAVGSAHQQQPQAASAAPAPPASVPGAGGGPQAAVAETEQALAAHGQSVAAAWQQISSSMRVPLCRGHKLPCNVRTTKKKNSPNFGRQFYVCAKPAGPKGDPAADCGHFEWATKPRAFKGGSGGAVGGGAGAAAGGGAGSGARAGR